MRHGFETAKTSPDLKRILLASYYDNAAPDGFNLSINDSSFDWVEYRE